MNSPSAKAMVLGLGLLAAAPLAAQTTASRTTSQDTSGLVLRDGKTLIGATLSTEGGRYGTISDFVYDGTGSVQYALVERQGQLHPVPFSLLQFGTTGDASVSLSSATLDSVSIDRNNLKSIFDSSFGSQLRAAFGPNLIRSTTNSNSTSSGTSTTSTSTTSTNASVRNQVFSLAGLLGGTINAQNGEAGTISTIAINPNGTFAYAVGVNSTGDARFAVPFAVSQLNAQANGLSVASPIATLTSIAVPQGSLPTTADQAFLAALTTAFGNQANSFVIGGANPPLSTAQMNLLARNDTFNNDPVVRAGNSSQAGSDAVAGAGDSRRGGADAVARAGDRSSTTGAGTTAAAAMRSNPSNAAPGSNSASAVQRPEVQRGNAANPPSTPTAPNTTGTTSTNTGGIVNLSQDVTPTQLNAGTNSGLIQMRDLLNYKVQAQDGAFGRVSDIVFDRNGNVQYLLGNYQGQTYPLPFSPTAFSASANNTLSYNVPVASLQQLAINPQQLPSLQNQAFTQRMQQVYGPSYAAYLGSSTYNGQMKTNQVGANNSTVTSSYPENTGGYRGGGREDIRPNPFTKGPTSGTGMKGTGTSAGTGTTTTGTTTDTWTWPTGVNGQYPAPPPGSGREDIRPNPYTKTPNSGTGMKGTGTGTGTGTRTGTGTGTGAQNGNQKYPQPPPGSGIIDDRGGFYKGASKTGANGANKGTTGGTSGTGGSSGSGTGGSSGSGSTGGSSGGGSGGSGS